MKERYMKCKICKNIIEEKKAYICEECLETVCYDCNELVPIYRDGVLYNALVCLDCADYLYAEYEEKMLELKRKEENEK
jgi:hypothetical protein